jgi:hypothetical protein
MLSRRLEQISGEPTPIGTAILPEFDQEMAGVGNLLGAFIGNPAAAIHA